MGVSNKMVKRNRQSAYRKRGLLFDVKGIQGPFKILLMEADSWPRLKSLRVQLCPNSVLDYSQNETHSLWTFLASSCTNGCTYDENLTLAFNCLGMRYSQSDAKEVFETFRMGVAVELWLRSSSCCNKVTTLIHPKYDKIVLLRHYCETEDELKRLYNFCETKKIYTRSSIEPHDAQFTCSIKTVHFCNFPNCPKYFFEENEINQHQLTCVNREEKVPKITFKCLRMSQYKPGEELLQALGFNYITQHFCSFDIETTTEPSQNPLNKRNQTLLSISVKKSWSSECVCFTRKSSDAGDGLRLVEEFISFLDIAHFEYQNQFADFQRIRNQLERYSTRWGINKSFEVQAATKLIDSMEKLKCYGFNAERFDTPELYPYLCVYYGMRKIEFEVIKRGAGKSKIQLFDN